MDIMDYLSIMDMLSEILNDAGWKSDILARDSLYKSWGYKFPCVKSGGFHVITQGFCYAKFLGLELSLLKGDLLFITRGISHELLSDPKAKVVEIQRFHEQNDAIRFEGGTSVTTFVSVRYEVPDRPQHPFFLELPPYIYIPATDISSHHALQSVINMISAELETNLGSDLILQRLTDIMLYHMIRYWLERNPGSKPGWIMAFRDNIVLRALEAIHRNPQIDWSVESLAKNVGISRANLALKFKEKLLIPPMEYLANLRMTKAREMFLKENTTLEEVAQAVGYSSAFAFSKAYKRIYGNSPAKEWKKVS